MSEQWRKLVVEFVRAAVLLDPVLHLDLVALLQTRAPEISPPPVVAHVPEPAGRDEGSNSSTSENSVQKPVDVTADGMSQLAQKLKAVGIDVNLVEMATWPEMRRIVADEWLKQGAKPEERPEWLPPPPKKPVDLLGLLRANVAAAKNAKEIEAKLPPPEEKKKRGRPKKVEEEKQPELFEADENVIPSDGPAY